ncbi:tRNA pseudouridine synthase D [Necator americanus]|uniref:tRNA pseudouridine synthase D n=2 Tax=Necator americanus TaxID=51031 RepID=W2TFL0_NECAM|nr:tRNA pseudouridine synthase D [Necator americanus]ETN80633.1 tRNA pseudouridine synthase D [Necator americanus]
MEVDYGISSYLGDRKIRVPCVLKELYSDFIVQEISADETVLRLATAPEVLNHLKKEEEKGVDDSVAVPSAITADQVSLLDAMNKDSKPILLCTEGLGKDDRKSVHEFLRLRYQGKLGSETKENGIEVNYCGVNSKTRKRKRWAKDCPNHCYFTLAKENKDTSYALGLLAKFLKYFPSSVTVNTFRTHGIKDRRAVTCQRVSCNRVEKERILSLNSRLRDIVVYDFSYEDHELKIGGHWGNRFSIILRNIPPDTQNILDDRLKDLREDGFINYFGTQRFGSCGTDTAVVGRHILRRDWEGAVRLILSNESMPGYLGTVGNAVRCWEETGDASQALKQLKGGQAFASIEAIIFRCLAKGVTSDDLGKNGKKLSNAASIFDVYVPLPGENENYEKNYVSEWYEEMLKEDNLTNSSFSSLEDRFALGETARAMLICPKDVKWKFIKYSEPRAHLQAGISTRAIDESEMMGDLMAMQVQFSLPSGCYATAALRQITGTDMGKRSMKVMWFSFSRICCE